MFYIQHTFCLLAFANVSQSPLQHPNPFSNYAMNTTLLGSAIFYNKVHKESVAHGRRRGPIYSKNDIDHHGVSMVTATTSSWFLLADGDGCVEEVEIRIVGPGGQFIMKLRSRDLYLCERSGKLHVARGEASVTKFLLQTTETGRTLLTTARGTRLYDNGEQGWMALPRNQCSGEALYMEFVSEDDKAVAMQGNWQSPYEFVWR